jgi:hypothetical protein
MGPLLVGTQNHEFWGGPRAQAGPASQAVWAVPDAPGWHALHWEPSDTPAPGACLHTCRTRTRRARSSCAAARPNPAEACAPCSVPASSLPQGAHWPLPASALPPLEGTTVTYPFD